MPSDDPQQPQKPGIEPESGRDPGDRSASLDTRFLWVLLGVMTAMVALPMLPETGRRIGGGALMLWLAYELWVLVFRTFAAKKDDA